MEVNCFKTLLITANVGSIFEDPESMLKIWLQEVLGRIAELAPAFIAIHCQEVGGKNYESSMQHVNQFIKTMLACDELHHYDRVRIFLDEDYTAQDKFTALGNLYFIHENLEDVHIWDFKDFQWIPLEGIEVLSGNIENTVVKEKAKFPQHFFPEFKWSRKGFLRTRWRVNGCDFDLVNIHLFHDASNIVAMESSPSLYSGNRNQALMHTLQRFENDAYDKVPMYIFGDFNFRLDSNLLIKALTSQAVAHSTKNKKDETSKIVYTEEDTQKVVLSLETKYFDYHDKHSQFFSNTNKWFNQFDREIVQLHDRLCEFPVNFPASYPFSEDVNDGMSYMKTRIPSWCDRILFSYSAKNFMLEDPPFDVKYTIIGKNVCMGDHKPVSLAFSMKCGEGNVVNSHQLKRVGSLSINGENCETSVDMINIHDYAIFEKEERLLPEFSSSFKHKHVAQSELAGSIPRKISFQQIAKQIVTIESVFRRWPRRRTRHHSSSSEDFSEGDDDEIEKSDSESLQTDVSIAPDNVTVNFFTSDDTPTAPSAKIETSNSILPNANNSVPDENLSNVSPLDNNNRTEYVSENSAPDSNAILPVSSTPEQQPTDSKRTSSRLAMKLEQITASEEPKRFCPCEIL